jgi:hypothetical protein
MFSEVRTQKVMINLANGSQEFLIPFEEEICGIVRMTVQNVECRDILGLFKHSMRFSYENDITVYPSHINIETVCSREFLMEHEGIVYDERKRGNDISEILNIKDYTYGDNIRNIHWKLSSKLGKPVVREFARQNNLNILLFCDLSLTNGKTDVSPIAITNNLAIITSISYNLIKMGIHHKVCVMDSETRIDAPVESIGDYLHMIGNIMNITLKRKSFDAASTFVNLGLGENFTKVVYAAEKYNPEGIKMIGERCDLTIILRNDGKENVFEEYENYKIISFAENGLYDRVHNITL